MKKAFEFTTLLLIMLGMFACNNGAKKTNNEPEKRRLVQIETTMGTMLLELYNETPQHRDNFITLIKDGVLDSLLFHRVIQDFMIQGGDPDSKYAPANVPLGNGGLNYRVSPEFHPDLFHKKGALAAARDGNPERASSSTQFYIVQGKVFNDSTLLSAEKRINHWLAQHYTKNDPSNKELSEKLQMAIENNDMVLYQQYNDSINALAKEFTAFEKYTIPEAHKIVYKTLGGTPHLDQNYTVFGEVIRGLHVVDSVAAVETGKYDRPVHDVRIVKVSLLN